MQTAQNASVVSGPAHFPLSKAKGPSARRSLADGWVGLGPSVAAAGGNDPGRLCALPLSALTAPWRSGSSESHKLRHLRYLRDLASICELFGRAECVAAGRHLDVAA